VLETPVPRQVEYVTKVAARATWNAGGLIWVGQNVVWGLSIAINAALVQGNATLVQDLFTVLWETIIVEPNGTDGTQVDGAGRMQHTRVRLGWQRAGLCRPLCVPRPAAKVLTHAPRVLPAPSPVRGSVHPAERRIPPAPPLTSKTRSHCESFHPVAPGVPAPSPPAGSFYQHGPLLQTASYGQSYTDTLVGLVTQTAGTAYAIPPGPTEAFATLLLDGQQYSLRTAADGSRRTSWDLLPEGRQVLCVCVRPGGSGDAGAQGAERHSVHRPCPPPPLCALCTAAAISRWQCVIM
jgi:hypothetical protein